MPEQQSNVVSLEEKKRRAKKISKQDILATAEKVEEEYIEDLDLLVPMRRLNDVEATDIQAAMSSGVEVSRDAEGNVKDMQVDIAAQVQGERFARRDAIAAALSVDGAYYEVEEVSKFPPNYVTAISDRVFTLSGMSNEQQEEIKKFREEQGGGADGVDASAGGPSGEEPAGADADAGGVSGGGAAEGGDETAGS